jgi:hypothetical protein
MNRRSNDSWPAAVSRSSNRQRWCEGGGGGGEGNDRRQRRRGSSCSGGSSGEGGEGAAGDKPTDAEAKLLKEVMKLKEQAKLANDKLKAYDGIDPVKARELQKAQEDAAVAAQEAERKRLLEEAGQFDAVKKQMVDQHTSEITKRDEAVKAANDALAAAQARSPS